MMADDYIFYTRNYDMDIYTGDEFTVGFNILWYNQ